jgi:uncharacterized phage-associated protein
MASVHDVAAYILSGAGPMTVMKLQKLAYYAHAWHLVWEEQPLFGAPIEARANGPVVRDLYEHHRGRFTVDTWPEGDPSRLDTDERSTVDAVLEYYGSRTAHELSQLTRGEEPWKRARAGLPPCAQCAHVIADADMHEYYDGLTASH